MNDEKIRLNDDLWKTWGPYVSNRQWGNVREDYSPNGNAWEFTGHDMAESYTYRWAEEGIAGISDNKQLLCFAFSFWNFKDKIIKERFFGLSNYQGNHGEDLKEIFYYLDNTPSHSYMKMLYKYPINAFPYEEIVKTNAERSKKDPEFEIDETGIFNNNEYFDIFIEYCKADVEDILIRVKVCNRSNKEAPIMLLPTLWYRNNWKWGYNQYKPNLSETQKGVINVEHDDLNIKKLYSRNTNLESAFCDNETNNVKLYGWPEKENTYYKDGINQFIINKTNSVNPNKTGTKAAFIISESIEAHAEKVFDFRLSPQDLKEPFSDFDEIFEKRIRESDEFYEDIQKDIPNLEEKNIQRQAFAGLLWNKQFYHYNVSKWLKGDPNLEAPRNFNQYIRNKEWKHLHNKDIISMPDKWEYPWYATWDLAFHCVPLSIIDPNFAKNQLVTLTKEWYMHPNGQLPAYEWNLDDVNPPVHAWSAFRVYKLDERFQGKPDVMFLESVFQKLLLNFTWWVNRKDINGNNIFGGGFLGLDNIGVFDRNMKLKDGEYLEQADGTSWMAMYALNMMRIAMELATYNPVYEDMAIKFFEHYLYIAEAMENIGGKKGLWNEEDGFFYDVLQMSDGDSVSLRLRSIVGLIPMFAVEVVDHALLEKLPNFTNRMEWILKNKPELTKLVSHWEVEGEGKKHLLSILRKTRVAKVLERMLDEKEFLSDYGIRALSKVYEEEPFVFNVHGTEHVVHYTPAESNSRMFGGNSNWRGPIWFPINFLIVESLQRFYFYYGDSLEVEFPYGSGKKYNLNYIAKDLSERLCNIFKTDEHGNRPFNGGKELFNKDPFFKNYIMFYEYFHGDNGRGVGASHQTGWTATVAKLIQPRETETPL